MSKELSAFHEIHNEVDSELITEYIVHTYKEWMFYIIENFHFKLKSINIFILKDNILSNALHCIYYFSFFMLNLKDFSESSFSNNSEQNKIIKLCRLAAFSCELSINVANWAINSLFYFIILIDIRIISFSAIHIVFLVEFWLVHIYFQFQLLLNIFVFNKNWLL